MGERADNMDLGEFVWEFNEKYLPPIAQEKRKDDFIKLRQGGLSVSEYETQFTKLSKFTPELIATEQRRVRRFVQGLNVEIQEALVAAQINIFTEIIPHSFYGYCGKNNHTEDNCWRKARKYLWCGNAEHQIATCPLFGET